jgi:predicted NUDIX family phosphoesterase
MTTASPNTNTNVSTEQVLVVSTKLFHTLGHFQGFSADTGTYLDELLNAANTSYRPRSEMEEDTSFKQLIPYVIIRRIDGDTTTIFEYTRGKGQGEKRLHAKRSVGIGGHISSDDEAAETSLHPYEEGMRRELDEEVIIDTPYTQKCVGLINDDETPVGQVHLGVVHILDVESPNVRPREEDILDCGFRPVQELLDNLDGFETWSQICLKALFKK